MFDIKLGLTYVCVMPAIEHPATALMPRPAVPSSGGYRATGPAPADHDTSPAPARHDTGPTPAGNGASPAPAGNDSSPPPAGNDSSPAPAGNGGGTAHAGNGAGSSPAGNASDLAAAGRGSGLATALRPLLIDVGVPVGSYYLLHNALGASLWLSLALSSIGPAVRAIAGLAARRELNLLAVLMLAVNLAGIAVSLLSGDPRAMIAKDSVISSVIAFGILISAALRHPLMSAGLKPFITKGKTERMAAWDRLSTASARFRRLEILFSTIWGLALLAECVARVVGAYTLPVTTMVWLGTVFTLGAIGLAMVVGGAAAGPMEKMVDAEAAA